MLVLCLNGHESWHFFLEVLKIGIISYMSRRLLFCLSDPENLYFVFDVLCILC